MNTHHEGDGCHGADRVLSREDHDAIAEQMAQMMMAAAKGAGRSVLRAGAYIGVHYGPSGEWALALRLATQVTGLAPVRDCHQDGTPILRKAFPADEHRVLLLTAYCIGQFPETRSHTRQEITDAVAAAVPLVERFVAHYKNDLKDDCRAAWEEMYEMTSTTMAANRENTLRAGACSALLTCWASHYSAVRIDV